MTKIKEESKREYGKMRILIYSKRAGTSTFGRHSSVIH